MRISTLCLHAALAAAPILAVNAAPAEKYATATIPTPVSLADGAYELGGFFGAGDKQEVSLKKRGESAAKWVRVGQKTGDLLVESVDSAHGFAIVNISGARYRLNLRGETATRLPAAGTTVSSGTLVIGSSAMLARPLTAENLSPEMKAKREKFAAIMSKLTPEQQQRLGESLGRKMDEAMKKNAAMGKEGGDLKQMRELSRVAFRDSIREALQTPGKDGTGTVPGDFNDLFDAASTGDTPLVGAATAGVIAVPDNPAGETGPAPATIQPGEPIVITSGVGRASIVTFSSGRAPAPAPVKAK